MLFVCYKNRIIVPCYFYERDMIIYVLASLGLMMKLLALWAVNLEIHLYKLLIHKCFIKTMYFIY